MESKPDPKLLFYRVSGRKTGGHFSWKHSSLRLMLFGQETPMAYQTRYLRLDRGTAVQASVCIDNRLSIRRSLAVWVILSLASWAAIAATLTGIIWASS